MRGGLEAFMIQLSRVRVALLLSILPLFSPAGAAAQVTGWIAGTVRDTSGAVLPGATVTVRGDALHVERVGVETTDEGSFRINLLPPGRYEVQVRLNGFNPLVQSDVEVGINRQTTLDVVLSVAAIEEQVEVSVAVPVVEVTRGDASARITTEAIDALPLNGRNFVDLVALVPGVRPVPEGQEGADVSIFGERGSALSFLVDGAENNNPLNGGPAVRFTQDSIQEFEVITTGYEAEFGRALGGVANVITRSGTNGVRGGAFWFARDDALDASNVAGQEPPRLERHQWGGTLGGPIQRDRAFFFASIERLDETRGVNIDRSRIPAFVADGLATPSGREDFAIGPEKGGYTAFGRIDVNFNVNHRLSMTMNRSTEEVGGEIGSPVAGTVALPSAARTETGNGAAIVVRQTSAFGAATFLETTAEYVDGLAGTNLDRSGRAEPILILLRTGFLQTGAPFGGRTRRDSGRWQIAQTMTTLREAAGGTHELKVGWDFNRVTLTGFDEVANDVEYSAAFLSPDAHELNADLFARLGFAQSAARFFTLPAEPGGSLDLDIDDRSISVFGQDSWSAGRGLTINAGVRYDWSSLFGDDSNNVAPRVGFAWDVGARRRTVVKGSWGLFFDRNLLGAAATVPEKGGIFTRSAFDVALPRLGSDYTDSLIDLVITSGFPAGPDTRSPPENPAYQALADALRADPLALYRLLGITVPDPSAPPVITADNVQQLSGLTPAQVLALLEGSFPGTDWEFFDVPGGSIVGDRVLSFFPRGPLALSRDVSVYADDRTPWTNALNVGIEQDLGHEVNVSAMYVRRRTRDLLTRRIVNLFDVPPGHPDFGRTVDGGPRVSQVTYDGLVDYDGVIVAARKRFADRHGFGLSYTASRARDNLLTGNVGSTFSNNNHPELDYGPSNQSAPHVFVAHAIATLPAGVRVSGIVFWRSGSAFNPRGIQDLDGDGLVDQRDTTEPRNAFRTKSYGNVDVRVEKTFGLPRDHRLAVLVEAFNLFNRANVANVSAVAGPAFGTPTTFFSGREMQIGVRYLFGGR